MKITKKSENPYFQNHRKIKTHSYCKHCMVYFKRKNGICLYYSETYQANKNIKEYDVIFSGSFEIFYLGKQFEGLLWL